MPIRKVELLIDIDQEIMQSLALFDKQLEDLQRSQNTITRGLYQVLNSLYLVEGCPHGDSHDGLMEWLSENPEWRASVRAAREAFGEMSSLSMGQFKKGYKSVPQKLEGIDPT